MFNIGSHWGRATAQTRPLPGHTVWGQTNRLLRAPRTNHRPITPGEPQQTLPEHSGPLQLQAGSAQARPRHQSGLRRDRGVADAMADGHGTWSESSRTDFGRPAKGCEAVGRTHGTILSESAFIPLSVSGGGDGAYYYFYYLQELSYNLSRQHV